MARAVRPGGTLLIANLTSFSTAGLHWKRDADGKAYFAIDRYLDERVEWVSWRGIRIHNWHRPLRSYMSLLLGAGLALRHFAEPAPVGGDPSRPTATAACRISSSWSGNGRRARALRRGASDATTAEQRRVQ